MGISAVPDVQLEGEGVIFEHLPFRQPVNEVDRGIIDG